MFLKMRYCTECGSKIAGTATFCAKCGKKKELLTGLKPDVPKYYIQTTLVACLIFLIAGAVLGRDSVILGIPYFIWALLNLFFLVYLLAKRFNHKSIIFAALFPITIVLSPFVVSLFPLLKLTAEFGIYLLIIILYACYKLWAGEYS